MKRFSLLLLFLFIISSCSEQNYKNRKNSNSIIYHGQRPTPRVEVKKPTHSELTQRNKALTDSKLNHKDFVEDDFHEVPPALQKGQTWQILYYENHYLGTDQGEISQDSKKTS